MFRSIGLNGEILETPGHSDDSISLVLDSGAAFVADLPSPEFVAPEDYELVCASWKKLLSRGVHVFFHGHTRP